MVLKGRLRIHSHREVINALLADTDSKRYEDLWYTIKWIYVMNGKSQASD